MGTPGLDGAGLMRQRAGVEHWRTVLAGGPRALTLPVDRAHGAAGATGRPARVFERAGWDLPCWAHADGFQASIVTLAGFVALLARYAEEEEIVLGVTLPGLSELPLRVALGDDPTFRQVLGAVRAAVERTRRHADWTLDEILQAREAGWSAEQDWPYRVAFRFTLAASAAAPNGISHSGMSHDSISHSGISPRGRDSLTPDGVTPAWPPLDLALTAAIADDLLLTLDYDAAQFDEATARRTLGHLATLLTAALAEPDRPIAALPLLTEAERQQMLIAWNATDAPYPADLCLHQHLEAQAARTPNAIALSFGAQTLTYAELDARANRLAHYLKGLGVGPEVLVGICMPRSIEAIVGVLAILKAGGAYLPLDPTYPEARLALMVEDAAVPLVLTADRLPDGLNPAARVVSIQAERGAIQRQPTTSPAVQVSPEQLAYVIYTSGSTGRPKGVEITHAAVLNTLLWLQEHFTLTADDVVAQKTALSFTDSVWEIFWTLIAGARLAVIEDAAVRDPNLLRQRLREERVTYTQFVPPQMTAFLKAAEAAGDHDLPRLRWIFNGGEALPLHLAQAWYAAFPRAIIANIYGMTESAIYATSYVVENTPDLAERGILVGTPIANARVYVLNEHGQPCPINVVGELYIGGVGIARGYRGQPELTAERFVPDPFGADPEAKLYRTGDCVRWRADGRLEYVGRRDHQVKIRGFRVELGEIEAGLARHPSVRQAVVVIRRDSVSPAAQSRASAPGRAAHAASSPTDQHGSGVAVSPAEQHGSGDARLVAYVVPRGEPWPTAGELRQHLQSFLPDYMVPAAIMVMAALPLTPSGKVDRRALPAPDDARTDDGVGFVAPRTVLERELAAIWEDVLGVRPVGVRDNFFDLGGHSLLAADVFTRIAERYGRSLPLSVLLEQGTVEHLAAILSDEVALPAWSPLVPIQPNGSKPPFFCVHPDHGDVVAFVTIAQHLGPDQPFYAFRARGLDGTEEPWTDLPAIAADYISHLRTVQPTGPYYIGGHSLGVGIAYEMAQQLTEAGETVALVALLDDTLYALETRFSLKEPETLGFYLRNVPLLARRIWTSPDGPRTTLARLAGGLLGQPRLYDAHEETGQYHARRFGGIQAAQYQAWMAYRPRVYPGRITLFRSAEQPLSRMRDPLMGWGKVAAGGVDVRVIGGCHDTLTREPYVRELAAQLALSLSDARVAVSAPAAEGAPEPDGAPVAAPA